MAAKTTRRLTLNWSFVQVAGAKPRSSVGDTALSISSVGDTALSIKVQVWRHNAQPQDSARDSGARCDAGRRSGPAAGDGERSGGKDRAAGAGGGAATSPIFATSGNLHPEYPPG